MAMMLMLSVFASQAAALGPQDPGPVPMQSLFKIELDSLGADDQPGQKDLNSQGIYSPAPGDLWVQWQWNDTAYSGGNTADACALFDSGALNGKVNFAVCVTIGGKPAEPEHGQPSRLHLRRWQGRPLYVDLHAGPAVATTPASSRTPSPTRTPA